MKNSTKLLISVLIIVVAAILLYLGLKVQLPQDTTTTSYQAEIDADTGAGASGASTNMMDDSSTMDTTSTTTDGTTSGQSGSVVADVVFQCSSNQAIHAVFMNDPNSVTLDLSDGRTMNLPQAVSADGARYANADESFVFWNVGNSATIQENGKTTYDQCVTTPTDGSAGASSDTSTGSMDATQQ